MADDQIPLCGIKNGGKPHLHETAGLPRILKKREVGFFLFNESCSVLRILCLIMIAGGIAGLKLLTK